MKILPTHYTDQAEGNWKPWPHGAVNAREISLLRPENNLIEIKGTQVRSLFFEVPAGAQNYFNVQAGWHTIPKITP